MHPDNIEWWLVDLVLPHRHCAQPCYGHSHLGEHSSSDSMSGSRTWRADKRGSQHHYLSRGMWRETRPTGRPAHHKGMATSCTQPRGFHQWL